MSFEHRTVVEALGSLLNRNDWGALDQVFAPDSVLEYPQSGEVFRGIANLRAQFENYPGGLVEGRIDALDVKPEEPRYAITAMYTILPVEGTGDRGSVTFKSRYPDGSVWWVIVMYRVEGDRIVHATTFFAPEFEAPEWRAPYREQTEEATSAS